MYILMSSNLSCIVFQLPRYHESIVVQEEKKVRTLHIACSFHVEFHTRGRRSGKGSTQGEGEGKAPPRGEWGLGSTQLLNPLMVSFSHFTLMLEFISVMYVKDEL